MTDLSTFVYLKYPHFTFISEDISAEFETLSSALFLFSLSILRKFPFPLLPPPFPLLLFLHEKSSFVLSLSF